MITEQNQRVQKTLLLLQAPRGHLTVEKPARQHCPEDKSVNVFKCAFERVSVFSANSWIAFFLII